MKIFNKATLKLTAIYTAIIMIITLAFSGVIGIITTGEIRRPFKAPSAMVELRVGDDVELAYSARAEKVESKVWTNLALVNLDVLIVGLIISYLMARWTLKPIERAMDDETRFVSDASHELRTPLATMRMENEILLRDKDTRKQDYKLQLQSNLDEIDKLHQLADTLLKLSGTSELDMGLVDAGNVAKQAIERISKTAEAKKIHIVNQVKHFVLTTNEDALAEIIYIYLDNAVKYAPESSKIEVFNADSHSISVRDHGSGVAEKDLPRIFNRFYRADESRNSSGFGLGLSLASRMARQLGGKVSVVNNKGKHAPGATFTVRIK